MGKIVSLWAGVQQPIICPQHTTHGLSNKVNSVNSAQCSSTDFGKGRLLGGQGQPLVHVVACSDTSGSITQIGSKTSVVKGIKRVALYITGEDKVADWDMLWIMRTVPRIKGKNRVWMRRWCTAESALWQTLELKGFLSLSDWIDVKAFYFPLFFSLSSSKKVLFKSTMKWKCKVGNPDPNSQQGRGGEGGHECWTQSVRRKAASFYQGERAIFHLCWPGMNLTPFSFLSKMEKRISMLIFIKYQPWALTMHRATSFNLFKSRRCAVLHPFQERISGEERWSEVTQLISSELGMHSWAVQLYSREQALCLISRRTSFSLLFHRAITKENIREGDGLHISI